MTSPPLVHGLDANLVPPDWPAPDPADLELVLAAYGLRPGQLPSWLSPRPLASSVLVSTSTGQVFVKRSNRRVRDAEGLREEHRFAEHLRSTGISTPEVLHTREGDTVFARGEWCYEVHAPAVGVDRYRDAMSWTPFGTPAEARSAGRSLALFHAAAATFTATHRSTEVLTSRPNALLAGSIRTAIAEFVTTRPAAELILAAARESDLDYLDSLLDTVAQPLRSLRQQWTHNDWHASNLFWRGLEVSSVIDFGLADLSYAVVDLAIAIERNMIRWLELPHPEISESTSTAALLAGYEDVTHLTAAEVALLPDLLPVIHLDFALSEVDYFAGILADPNRGTVAWRDYAVGHANWFTTEQGRTFQHLVRTCLVR
jgi:Ser/Thr protein kinase RdoA (MazF antagonist)